MARVLIGGCGDVGTALGRMLAERGHRVWGLRRTPGDPAPGVTGIAADLTDPGGIAEVPEGIDLLFYTAAPDGREDAAYRRIYVDGLRRFLDAFTGDDRSRPLRLFYVSSTSVYGQDQGEWVDEDSATAPTRFTGRRVLEGERVAAGFSAPATSIRLGGVYGPGRTRLIERVRAGDPGPPASPARYTNRIHRDDAAAALCHLTSLDNPSDCYLGVDDDPASAFTVHAWIAEKLGIPSDIATEPKPERVGQGKRCRNSRLRATGFVFRYPTFREGYADLLGR